MTSVQVHTFLFRGKVGFQASSEVLGRKLSSFPSSNTQLGKSVHHACSLEQALPGPY